MTRIIRLLFGALVLAALGWAPANARDQRPCSGGMEGLSQSPNGQSARLDIRKPFSPCTQLATHDSDGAGDGGGGAALAACPRNMKRVGLAPGRALRCSCARYQMVGSVWGTRRYTADSSICKAARHAGVVGPNGGNVAVFSGGGCRRFLGTVRYGIRTGRWGAYQRTFAFRYPMPRCFGGVSTPVRACNPSFGGKYVNLLRRINVPRDRGRYGMCRDYGRYSGSSWAGYRNLPAGYWTYKYPYWYIWGQRTR